LHCCSSLDPLRCSSRFRIADLQQGIDVAGPDGCMWLSYSIASSRRHARLASAGQPREKRPSSVTGQDIRGRGDRRPSQSGGDPSAATDGRGSRHGHRGLEGAHPGSSARSFSARSKLSGPRYGHRARTSSAIVMGSDGTGRPAAASSSRSRRARSASSRSMALQKSQSSRRPSRRRQPPSAGRSA
jgi:hypothetical protein